MGEVKQIEIQNQTYYFYNSTINLKNFEPNLKIDKNHIKTLIFTALDILQLKKLMIMKVLTVQILCIYVLIIQTDMSKNKMEYLIFDTTDENKELLKKYKDVWNGIKNKI